MEYHWQFSTQYFSTNSGNTVSWKRKLLPSVQSWWSIHEFGSQYKKRVSVFWPFATFSLIWYQHKSGAWLVESKIQRTCLFSVQCPAGHRHKLSLKYCCCVWYIRDGSGDDVCYVDYDISPRSPQRFVIWWWSMMIMIMTMMASVWYVDHGM